MKVAVIQFPGSNCDQDALFALRTDVGVGAEYVWHDATSLSGFDGVFLPGGFSYGDYLRCGAMAARAPIMDEVRRFATEGRPVVGACNGFQVLCEAGLLPGALMQNASEKFVCRDVFLQAVNRTSLWTANVDRILRIPIAHGEGRFVASDEVLKQLESEGRVAFRYVNAKEWHGHPAHVPERIASEANPNGSSNNIAGIVNERGNVLGLMPHPERASNPLLGSDDGLLILKGLTSVLSNV